MRSQSLLAVGVTHWQTQLTVAMGNAVDHPELLLQPYQLLELYPTLARLYTEGLERGLLMVPGNNIGYFGPYEHLWRAGTRHRTRRRTRRCWCPGVKPGAPGPAR